MKFRQHTGLAGLAAAAAGGPFTLSVSRGGRPSPRRGRPPCCGPMGKVSVDHRYRCYVVPKGLRRIRRGTIHWL
jgi:hypothetical protein